MRTHKFFIQSLFVLLIITYIAINWITLTSFPYVHSDEAWLSGFSRTVLDKGTFVTTEPFFDLYPRAIHGLRVIFVSIQMLFIKLFGYSINTMRSVSLLLSFLSLSILYKLSKYLSKKTFDRLLMTGIIAIMCQFIMMSHIARQEPFILLGMISAYGLMAYSNQDYKHVLIPVIIGFCIGIHPNSFIIGLSIGLLYLYDLTLGQVNLKHVLGYVLQLSLWAGIFITISFKLNPNFISDYLAFGDQLGVITHSLNRFQGFYYYYYKLWQEIGGTYVLVPIQADLMASFLGLLTTLYILFNKKLKGNRPLYLNALMVIGINLGFFIIGRYNQTAIIFVFVFGWLLFFNVLMALKKQTKLEAFVVPFLCLLFLFQGYNTYNTITTAQHDDYNTFGSKISATIPKEAKVLANLNMDYHLDLYQLQDIRNLDYLDENNLTFSDYIEKHKIEYIVLYEEMTYIHDARGKWDILYGSLPYYQDMMAYIDQYGEEIGHFKSPTYAMRIAKYVDVYPWGVTIYKLSTCK